MRAARVASVINSSWGVVSAVFMVVGPLLFCVDAKQAAVFCGFLAIITALWEINSTIDSGGREPLLKPGDKK